MGFTNCVSQYEHLRASDYRPNVREALRRRHQRLPSGCSRQEGWPSQGAGEGRRKAKQRGRKGRPKEG